MARFFARRLAGFAAVLLALSFIIFSAGLGSRGPVSEFWLALLTPGVRVLLLPPNTGWMRPLLLHIGIGCFQALQETLEAPCAPRLPLLTSSPHASD